ncbi:MAG: hypothetical protein AAF533_28585 [Acidobacteriota bacterium]
MAEDERIELARLRRELRDRRLPDVGEDWGSSPRLAVLPRSGGQEVRVGWAQGRGQGLNLRMWAPTRDGSVMAPSPKVGILLRPDELLAVRAAVDQAIGIARAAGQLAPESAA